MTPDEFESKVIGKVRKIKKLFDDIYYCKLILLEDNELVGFISIFTSDGEERKDLSPWYATMYVKKSIEEKDIQKY